MTTSKQNLYMICSFLAGFSLMAIEIVSSRIVAPIIGNSVYTWTSVIGITLLGLAIGSTLGGILADRFASNKLLAWVFLLSAMCVSIISPLSQHTAWITNFSSSIIFLNIFICFYLFLIPAITLGLIQPIILKKYTTDFSQLGFKYGLLSTVWSLGSILGVFITGFYLISTIGSQMTVYIIGITLLIISIILFLINKEKKTLPIITVSIFVCIILINSTTTNRTNIIYSTDSNYYKIQVLNFNMEPYGESRALLLDYGAHSIESKNILKSKYTEIYPTFQIFNHNIRDILIIGGGAYTLPKLLANFYPTSTVSVIEIDPEVEKTSNTFFGLDSNKIKTIVGDARYLINKNQKKYDLIYGDAYNSFISVPGQLLTEEYNNTIRKSLNPNGLYGINFIGSLSGDKAELFKSITNTFIKTFPNYYIFAFSNDRSNTQNITLLGINSPTHISEVLIKDSLKQGVNSFLADKIILLPEIYLDKNAQILTDNFYPTEKLLTNTVKNYFPDFLSFMKKII